MSRIKALQASPTAAVSSEGLWFSSSATTLLCFAVWYSTDDSPLPISFSVFLLSVVKALEKEAEVLMFFCLSACNEDAAYAGKYEG